MPCFSELTIRPSSHSLCDDCHALWLDLNAAERSYVLTRWDQLGGDPGTLSCRCADTTTTNSTDDWYQAECAATLKRSTTSTSTTKAPRSRQLGQERMDKWMEWVEESDG